jgi:hypothetical protein
MMEDFKLMTIKLGITAVSKGCIEGTLLGEDSVHTPIKFIL